MTRLLRVHPGAEAVMAPLGEVPVSDPESAAVLSGADGIAGTSPSGMSAAVPLDRRNHGYTRGERLDNPETRLEDRTLARELLADLSFHLFGFCGYCGSPSVGPTCRQHRDLLELDTSMPRGAR